jgi:hypothetical protein
MATAETKKTAKDKNSKLVEGFLYYFKCPRNKDGST